MFVKNKYKIHTTNKHIIVALLYIEGYNGGNKVNVGIMYIRRFL